MNETQMRSLLCAVDRGSINKAARELYVSPPSLLQRLNALEAEFGCALLRRSPRGVVATEAGECLYRACEQCVGILDEARRDIAAGSLEGAPEVVRIGSQWRAPLYVYHAFDALKKAHPRLSATVVKCVEKPLNECLRDGAIDLYEGMRTVPADETSGIAFHSFGTAAYRCVCGPQSPWASCDPVTLDMLDDVTVYAGSDYRTFYSYRDYEPIARLCARGNFKTAPVSTEQIVSDCLNNAAVVLFTAGRAGELCPPLVHVPLAIPEAEFGAYTVADPSPGVRAVTAALEASRLACG